jgi:transposase
VLILCDAGAMTKPYSEDLRTRIVRAVSEEGMSRPQAAARFAVSLPSVKRYLRQWRERGTLIPRVAPGRAPAIPHRQHAAVVAQLAAHPDATLEEHCERWHAATGVRVSASTWCRMRRRVGWTHKKSP